MCTVSMVLNWGTEKLQPIQPYVVPNTTSGTVVVNYEPSDEWRRRFLTDLLDLLKKAKQYDADNGEPDCELDSKKEKLKAIADELGVEISFS